MVDKSFLRMIINRVKERKFVLRVTVNIKKEKFNTQFPSVISIEIYFHVQIHAL